MDQIFESQTDIPINVKALFFREPPGNQFIFDPKTDIPKADWAEIERYAKTEPDDNDYFRWRSHAQTLYHLKLLDPAKATNLINGHKLSKIKRILLAKSQEGTIRNHLLVGNILKILYVPKTVDLNLDDLVFADFLRDYFLTIQLGNWYNTSEVGRELIVCFPERKGELKLTEDLFNKIKAHADTDSMQPQNYYGFMYILSNLKFLYPDHGQELVNNPLVYKFKDVMSEERQKRNWYGYIHMAHFASILSATNVQISNQGISLITSKPLATSSRPVLPELRRF